MLGEVFERFVDRNPISVRVRGTLERVLGAVPYRIALKTEEPFAFAGIWSAIHDAQGILQPTFAILTTEANALVSQIHTRMPVILHAEDEADWLNPGLALDAAQALLMPLPAELLIAYKVSPQVNSPTYNSPDLLQPVAQE